MIKQKWTVTVDGGDHTVEYECSAIFGKTRLIVDGDSFAVRGKLFGIGLERRETIMVGGAQAILDVKRGGKAQLICREGEVEEA
ncbi:MAG: hypothetical protein IJC64_00975 [Clostridia bacterium]|nr:hypothetical protein [Clostridia bacterium]